jgi:hypothetical protein
MGGRLHLELAAATALALVLPGAALAAGPLAGRTYQGALPSTGTDSEGHRKELQPAGKIVLRVARNGRSVTVRFTGPFPIIYCVSEEPMKQQVTHAAAISASGRFRASVGERFTTGPGEPSVFQTVSGQFSGRKVRGTIRTQPSECGGTLSFSATVQ